MKKLKIVLVSASVLTLLTIGGVIAFFNVNEKPISTTSTSAVTTTKASLTPALGEFHSEDKAFERLANSKKDQVLTEEVVGDGFELFDFAKVRNEEGRILPAKLDENAINADSAKSAASQILWNARHNEVALEDLLRTYGFNTPKEYVETKDEKRFLSKEAQQYYYAVENFLTKETKLNEGYYNVLQTATTTGMQDGKLVQDNTPKDWSNYRMLEVATKNGELFYHNYYCANSLIPTPHQGVEKVAIPEPSVKPDRPQEKKEEPKTPQPTPTTPQTVPKKVEESPSFNQGAGVIDNSSNPQTVWVEPSETYVAPEAPKAPQQQNSPQSSTVTTTQSGSWSGAGSFTDSNGTTTVAPNGAVNTPTQSLPELTGPNVVVPEVENGFDGNVGVNDSYKSNNDIPMD